MTPPPTHSPHSPPRRRRLNPAKLLLSKWTAVSPQNREKHFIVTRLIVSETAAAAEVTSATVEAVELEAVHSRRSEVLPWRVLCDRTRWLQGWQ